MIMTDHDRNARKIGSCVRLGLSDIQNVYYRGLAPPQKKGPEL